MAFKMKLGSKDLDGLYSINNKQTDAIKSGSGGLGMAGQVPDGPGDSGMAMNDSGMYMKDSGIHMKDSGMYEKDEFGTEIPKGFVDDSGSGGVTGTFGNFDSSDYTRGGNPAQVGQKRTDGGEVLNTYRDSKGKKKSGKAGQIGVKGVTFS